MNLSTAFTLAKFDLVKSYLYQTVPGPATPCTGTEGPLYLDLQVHLSGQCNPDCGWEGKATGVEIGESWGAEKKGEKGSVAGLSRQGPDRSDRAKCDYGMRPAEMLRSMKHRPSCVSECLFAVYAVMHVSNTGISRSRAPEDKATHGPPMTKVALCRPI